jgi:hypothetical protein
MIKPVKNEGKNMACRRKGLLSIRLCEKATDTFIPNEKQVLANEVLAVCVPHDWHAGWSIPRNRRQRSPESNHPFNAVEEYGSLLRFAKKEQATMAQDGRSKVAV